MHPDIHNTMAAAEVLIKLPARANKIDRGRIPDIVSTPVAGTNYVIVVPEGVTEISKDDFEGVFYDHGRRKDPQQAQVVAIELPNSLTEIPRELFLRNKTLMKVTIGNGVKIIHERAFRSCERLETVIMRPGGGTDLTLDMAAFMNCKMLERVEFPNNISVLGHLAFSGCVKLTSFTITDSVVQIGENVFSRCTGLETVTISSKAEISEECFKWCSSLTSVDFTLEKIPPLGNLVFEGCTSLVVDPEWVDRFTTVALDAFKGVPPFPLWLAELNGTKYEVKNWNIPLLSGTETFIEGSDQTKYLKRHATAQHPTLRSAKWNLHTIGDSDHTTDYHLQHALFLFESGQWGDDTDLTNYWVVFWEEESAEDDYAGTADEATSGIKRGRHGNDDGGAAAKSFKPSGLSFTDLAI